MHNREQAIIGNDAEHTLRKNAGYSRYRKTDVQTGEH
jgi:hypothetical protein